MTTLNELAERQLADSNRWFPSVHQPRTLTGQQSAVLHFALGAAGEAGEIANKAKKWLGYLDQGSQYSDEWLVENMADEIPDVIVYLLDLAATLDIDIDRALADKRGVCMGRWEPGYTWRTVPIGHVVPGCGEIIAKVPHTADGFHITFRREPGGYCPGEEWSAFRLAGGAVPVALTSHGLVYPAHRNITTEVPLSEDQEVHRG